MWYRKVTGDKLPIMDTWWQTETGAIMISPTPIMPLKPGSATKPFLGIEADVVDKQGNPVPEGDGGYLIIRQPWPSMMRTIYRDAERYETYWRTIEGVYFAGDSAFRDADGYFWIQGRVDDVIKKAGHRLGSSEIESALVSHPAVAEAAVIGKPDEVKGESIKAFVILKTGYSGSDALMQELIKARPRDGRPDRAAGRTGVRAEPAEDAQRQDHAPLHQGAGTRPAHRRPLDAGGVTQTATGTAGGGSSSALLVCADRCGPRDVAPD